MLLRMISGRGRRGSGDRLERWRAVPGRFAGLCAAAVSVGLGVLVGSGAGAVVVPRVSQVFVVSVRGHRIQRVTSGSVSHGVVQWLPGGHAVADVASAASTTWVERDTLAGRRIELSPRLRPASVLLRFSAASGLTGIGSVDENTNINTIAVVGRHSRRRVLDRFFQDPGPQAPAWSPDGRLVAYTRPFGRVRVTGGIPTAGPQHIVVMRSDGHGRHLL